ncbi:MAG: histidine phosphatase family protein [bacterium]|nr:histidine phosphatase family protein [bacterium]
MTTVYFVTPPKEKEQVTIITEFLNDKGIEVIFSSPFRSAIEAIKGFGVENEIPMYAVTEFGEMEVNNEPKETFEEVQERMIDGLSMLATNEEGKTIAVCTHPIALSSAIQFFDETFSEADTDRLKANAPVIVKFEFEGEICKNIEEIKAI